MHHRMYRKNVESEINIHSLVLSNADQERLISAAATIKRLSGSDFGQKKSFQLQANLSFLQIYVFVYVRFLCLHLPVVFSPPTPRPFLFNFRCSAFLILSGFNFFEQFCFLISFFSLPTHSVQLRSTFVDDFFFVALLCLIFSSFFRALFALFH